VCVFVSYILYFSRRLDGGEGRKLLINGERASSGEEAETP